MKAVVLTAYVLGGKIGLRDMLGLAENICCVCRIKTTDQRIELFIEEFKV